MTDIIDNYIIETDSHAFPELVLLHGAWHDSSCWEKVLPLLRKQGFTVHTPDLPGHDRDAVSINKVSLKHYVQTITDILEQAKRPLALLGHSMAGMVITQAACKVPDKIHSLLYLCAYLPRDGESLFDLIQLNRQMKGPCAIEDAMQLSADKRYCSIPPEQRVPLFYSQCAESLQPQLRDKFRQQATLPLSSATHFEQEIFTTMPSYYICCSKDMVLPVSHQYNMLSRQPCKNLLQLESDHSPFYSCPEQLSALLCAILAE